MERAFFSLPAINLNFNGNKILNELIVALNEKNELKMFIPIESNAMQAAR